MSEQPSLADFTAGTTTEPVVQTVVLELETSARKNERVQTGIEEFQEMAGYMANMMPSIPEWEWSPQNNTLYRMVRREFDDATVKATTAREAAQHVAESFASWRSRGKDGERPRFGNGSYLILSHQDFDLEENDCGYGLKASFIPYKPEWFHIEPVGYQRDYLERIFEGDADTGSCELHLEPDGTLRAHLVVKWDVEVYEPADVTTTVGVDIGENVIYAAAIVTSDGVDAVEVQSGREFRHYRNRLDEKRARLMQQNDLRGVKKCRNERERYTEQVLDTASREIVDLAVKHRPAVIALEDLTHYRESENAIHDWPFAMLQEKIAYKAKAEQIPVKTVDPYHTSVTCRACGQTNPEYRDGSDFVCTRCGYEVHADVNAAINITHRRLENAGKDDVCETLRYHS